MKSRCGVVGKMSRRGQWRDNREDGERVESEMVDASEREGERASERGEQARERKGWRASL